jgi:hypothetical protein
MVVSIRNSVPTRWEMIKHHWSNLCRNHSNRRVKLKLKIGPHGYKRLMKTQLLQLIGKECDLRINNLLTISLKQRYRMIIHRPLWRQPHLTNKISLVNQLFSSDKLKVRTPWLRHLKTLILNSSTSKLCYSVMPLIWIQKRSTLRITSPPRLLRRNVATSNRMRRTLTKALSESTMRIVSQSSWTSSSQSRSSCLKGWSGRRSAFLACSMDMEVLPVQTTWGITCTTLSFRTINSLSTLKRQSQQVSKSANAISFTLWSWRRQGPKSRTQDRLLAQNDQAVARLW